MSYAGRHAYIAADDDALRERNAAAGTCPLSFLGTRLFLFSFIAGTEVRMARHFAKHYSRAVGVAPQNMRLFVVPTAGNSSDRASLETARVFADIGVPRANVQTMHGMAFTERGRLSLLNEAMRKLPVDAWVIHADVDELFTFPCTLERQLARRQDEIFCAEMQDRLSPNGRVVELKEGSPIEEQFPLPCYVRQHYRRAGGSATTVSKVVLVRVWHGQGGKPRAFVDPHHISGYKRYGMRCRSIGYFAHYSLTAQALRFIREVKLSKGHSLRRNQFVRSMYVSLANFLAAHVDQGDARSHPWCQPPTEPAPRDVTVFTNSLLDRCRDGWTRLGEARAV